MPLFQSPSQLVPVALPQTPPPLLLRIASLRASDSRPSASLLAATTRLERITLRKFGNPTATSTASTAMVTMSSINVKPLDRRKDMKRSPALMTQKMNVPPPISKRRQDERSPGGDRRQWVDADREPAAAPCPPPVRSDPQAMTL